MIKLYEAEGQEADLVINDIESEGDRMSKVVTYLGDRSESKKELDSEPDLPNKKEHKNKAVYWGESRIVFVEI